MNPEDVALIKSMGLAQVPFVEKVPKSSSASEGYRKLGNQMFKDLKFKAAIEAYNCSLCYAPTGSKEIALIYGNRSAVYFWMNEHALCIENIKLAREHGFPAEKMAQLDSREEKCKKFLETCAPVETFDASSFFKLSLPPNEKIPFIAGCLELRKCEQFGRGIFTTKDLKAGDIISIEEPAFSCPTSLRGEQCSVCMKAKKGSLLPCPHCTAVMYCSKKCQEEAAPLHLDDSFNDFENGAFEESLKLQRESFEIAGGVNEALELLKDSEDKTIFDFDFSDPEDPDYKKKMLIALNGLRKNSKQVIKEKPDQLLNVPQIKERPRTAKERKQLLRFAINQFKIISANLSLFKKHRHGVLVFKSLLNHSCLPNVHPHLFGSKVALLVNHPIKAGAQIFVCYCYPAILHTKQQRLEGLKNHPFECKCEACVRNYPILPQMPRKDSSFVSTVVPSIETPKPAEAIREFRKNCEYIDKNHWKMPCVEVAMLMARNTLLIQSIDEK